MTELERIAEGVWGACTLFSIGLGVHLPTRMTVLRDEAGLVLVSPIALNAPLQQHLADLGTVHTIIAPNRMHYAYLQAARDLYPNAQILGVNGLEQKCPELPFRPLQDDRDLSEQIAVKLVAGAEKLSEAVLLHKPSGTLVVTDLVFNIHEGGLMTQCMLKLASGALGRVEQSRLLRYLTNDRVAAGHSVEKILQWPFERVVPAHGKVIEEQAQQLLATGLWWMRGLHKRPPCAH